MREIKFSQSIIVWALYIGSIPIYDYSLGVRVHPPLYIISVVDLVYNGSKKPETVASQIWLRVENTIISCKANAIKTEIEVGEYFLIVEY